MQDMDSLGPHTSEPAWKVGALAKATGLTVRALHHYDHIGLLKPSARTAAGHRLYTAGDVARLYRVSLLRRLGFPLEQITSVLDDPEWQLAAAVRQHLKHAQEQAAIVVRLCARLAGMAGQQGARRVGAAGAPARAGSGHGAGGVVDVRAAAGGAFRCADHPGFE